MPETRSIDVMLGQDDPSRTAIVRTDRIRRVKIAFISASLTLSVCAWALVAREIALGRTTIADIAIFLFMLMATGLGVERGFHRLITHRTFKCKQAIRYLFAALGSMAGQGPVIGWTSIHRLHHRFTDREGDPHSPLAGSDTGLLATLRGLWHAHLGWQFNDELPNSAVFARDLLGDRTMNRINRLYVVWLGVGFVVPAILGLLLIGSVEGAYRGLVWGGFARWFFSTNLSYAINSLCHRFGARPFESPDGSTNLWWLAAPTFGAAWHNDHHAFPQSALVGFSPRQVDLSGLVICGMARIGWAWDVTVPSADALNRRHRVPDSSPGTTISTDRSSAPERSGAAPGGVAPPGERDERHASAVDVPHAT